jgi:glycosyltransferase involved in cell wall biosynthesis
MVSVLISTRNEEQDLPGCLESVAWSDDIHVYDSGSTDRTVEVARAAGAKVSVREVGQSPLSFGGDESLHRNWALRNIPFKYPWVFSIDADERMSRPLVEAVCAAVRNPGDHVAFRMRRRDYLRHRWLKHVQAMPFYLRLFRPEKMHYEGLVNPRFLADGEIGELNGHLDHFPFSKGMTHWLDRHNSYSTLEARKIIANRLEAKSPFRISSAFLAREVFERRYHQKELFYRLPCRPVFKFVLLYILKGGFLDGGPGFTYAALQSFYEYMIVLKTREAERERRAIREEMSESRETNTARSVPFSDSQLPTQR